MLESTWAANASLSSKRSMSSTARSLRFRSVLIPSAGASKMSLGATPTVQESTIRQSGSAPISRALCSLATMIAAAPSEICDALPAVTVPSLAKTGLSFASFSADVSGRKPSSVSTACFCLSCPAESPAISALNQQFFVASAARWCDCAE